MNPNLLRTQYPETLIQKGYTLKCDPGRFKYFLGTENKEILGIEKRSTWLNLDDIPLSNGDVSLQTKNPLLIKLCAKFGYSLEYLLMPHSKNNIKARAMYAKISLRQGKTPKEIAKELSLNVSSMYVPPFLLGKYSRKNKKQ